MAVSKQDLATAAAWLECNEGDQGEADACHRVADWIQAEIERREVAAMARQNGVKVSTVRHAIRKATQAGDTK